MMTYFTLAAALLTFSPSALAIGDFSGHWIANQGTVSGAVGSTCSQVEIIITQTAQEVTTQKYDANCGSFSTGWGPLSEIVHGGTISDEDGDPIGTIDNTQIIASIPDSGVEGIVYTYNLTLVTGSDGQPQLKTKYGTADSYGGMMVEATLHRVSAR